MLLFIAGMLGVSLMVWLLGMPPQVLAFATGVALLGYGAYALPKMRRLLAHVKQLRQANNGERAVAEYLDLLREDGCRVLHDLVGDGFNVDHVVIAPQGVYTIETKTFSKPVNHNATVRYDGEQLRVGAFPPERDPIVQAKAQAAWLKQLLQGSTGKTFTVRPVVVFPGWWVEQPPSPAHVWVIEPKMFRGMLQQAPVILTKEQISMATFHLKRYIRSASTFRR